MKKYLLSIMFVLSCVFCMAVGTKKVQAATDTNAYQQIGFKQGTQKIGKYKFKRVEDDLGFKEINIKNASGKTVYTLKCDPGNTYTNGKTVIFKKDNDKRVYKLNLATKKVTTVKKFKHDMTICHVYKSSIYVNFLNDEPSDRATLQVYNMKTKKLNTITNNAYEFEGKGKFLQYKIYHGKDAGKVYKRNCSTGKTVLVK